MALTIVAIIGGVICIAVLAGFIRSLWRKPPRDPGSSDPLGGMRPGGPGGDAM